jgi:3-hydroxybutyryl-CoA dehydrogenase
VSDQLQIERVGVIGAGTMGSGIAEVCARAGVHTIVVDLDDEYVAACRVKIQQSLDKAVGKGRLAAEERDATLDRLAFVTDLDALSDRDLIIEAIVESEPEKITVFQALDKLLRPEAILASNTSSIPIIRLAKATQRPDRVLGMHFFNPAPVQPLVELVSSLATSDDTVDTVQAFTGGVLGKHVVRCGDRAGFVVNALLVPFLLSAIRMLDSGYATAEDIDNGIRYGCAHPMGPLALCDLIGLDTIKAVSDVLYEEWNEPLYAPPPLLKRMVSAGHLGRKSGRGFFTYS